ncbi:hypothetical protein B296_00006420 [Ensete ventricosum]|uniref:C3H1-type domain-containing protein n=1 Tax=Ensete ventricosum TaxID=4639 RepID=A0A426Z6Z0_ENSVE|nr:hypothetical protein B296_00006420 [Ensete ventricosum]
MERWLLYPLVYPPFRVGGSLWDPLRGSEVVWFCDRFTSSEGGRTGSDMSGGVTETQTEAPAAAELLLELAASDDLPAFRRAVEDDGHALDAAAPWYCRRSGGRGMGLLQRTPLMVAALHGSTAVLEYVLAACPSEALRCSSSDAATALHCAASGGAASSPTAVELLLAASADVDALDAAGNRPGDVIARQLPAPVARSLEVTLKAPSLPRVPSPGKGGEAKQGEKKEYPPDSTLPDIKNGIYCTDEFRMYTFKVKPCSRAYSHDWTECPFVHPGENARRRDPRKFLYSCVPCPEFRKGSCRNGDACEYAHGVFESWLHPAQYRTRLCKDEIGCNRRVCFFAHKPEELRTVNPMAASVTGMVAPSPGLSSPRLSPLDMATALLLMQQQQQPGSPMSPSALSSSAAAAAWMSQHGSATPPPSLQLPSSRLKASLSARDMEFNLDMLGLGGYQHKLIDNISSSPRANWGNNSLVAAATGTRSSEFTDPLGPLNPSLLTQLQGLSMNPTVPQFQSPTGIRMPQPQLLSGYGGNLPSSPPTTATPILGPDHSMAKAIMNSRAASFANRSQSFCDRGGRQSTISAAINSAVATESALSDWGSPDGKLDWGVRGEELNKLRKSASFDFRYKHNTSGALSTASAALEFDEPDVSWVQSLVKDGPVPLGGRIDMGKQQNEHQTNGEGDFYCPEMFSAGTKQEKLMA